MTDNDIIKALECCCRDDNNKVNLDGPCRDCSIINDRDCTQTLRKFTLDLIKRQQAEIERLTKANESFCEAGGKLVVELKKAKSEAIKEFAERLKEKLRDVVRYDIGEHTYYMVGESLIDNLAKEMVGDNND